MVLTFVSAVFEMILELGLLNEHGFMNLRFLIVTLLDPNNLT